MRKSILLVFILFLGACAGPFAKFYFDKTGGIDITTSPNVVVSQEKPKLFQGRDPQEDEIRMLEDGFNLVGYSSFNGAGNVNIKEALIQAEKVHAAVVLVYSKYTGTKSGASWGGWWNQYGGSSGGQVYNVERFDYLAAYWIKLKPPVFGVQVRDLTPEMRQKNGSNKGVLVYAVIKNSPAFRADIFKGDILIKISDVELYDYKSFSEALSKFAGQKVIVDILRDGSGLQKEIQLDQRKLN